MRLKHDRIFSTWLRIKQLIKQGAKTGATGYLTIVLNRKFKYVVYYVLRMTTFAVSVSRLDCYLKTASILFAKKNCVGWFAHLVTCERMG